MSKCFRERPAEVPLQHQSDVLAVSSLPSPPALELCDHKRASLNPLPLQPVFKNLFNPALSPLQGRGRARKHHKEEGMEVRDALLIYFCRRCVFLFFFSF